MVKFTEDQADKFIGEWHGSLMDTRGDYASFYVDISDIEVDSGKITCGVILRIYKDGYQNDENPSVELAGDSIEINSEPLKFKLRAKYKKSSDEIQYSASSKFGKARNEIIYKMMKGLPISDIVNESLGDVLCENAPHLDRGSGETEFKIYSSLMASNDESLDAKDFYEKFKSKTKFYDARSYRPSDRVKAMIVLKGIFEKECLAKKLKCVEQSFDFDEMMKIISSGKLVVLDRIISRSMVESGVGMSFRSKKRIACKSVEEVKTLCADKPLKLKKEDYSYRSMYLVVGYNKATNELLVANDYGAFWMSKSDVETIKKAYKNQKILYVEKSK